MSNYIMKNNKKHTTIKYNQVIELWINNNFACTEIFL